MVRITFEEKKFTTSTQWPKSTIGGLKKAHEGEEYLTDFANTKHVIQIDSSGVQNIDVTWIEGNADIRMPMEMWNDVKDKTNPVDPKSNPMIRYTLINGLYTAYGKDGSVIFSTTFPVDTIPPIDTTIIPSGKINSKINLVPVGLMSAKPINEIAESYRKKGIKCKVFGDYALLIEKEITTPKGNVLTKAVINARSGLPERIASYTTKGKLSNVVLLSYKDVNGYYYPATIVEYMMGNLADGTWGILTKTIQARTNLTIETR
ncbi:MAG TPA: hypothetical protein VNJ29_01310 [Candidatus Nitrosotenuis sp.]|nr:hypothetical protein [Candidatus Nitrosotenuis sp.]